MLNKILFVFCLVFLTFSVKAEDVAPNPIFLNGDEEKIAEMPPVLLETTEDEKAFLEDELQTEVKTETEEATSSDEYTKIVTLNLNEEVTITDATPKPLKLTLVNVHDSRCPEDSVCEWAGEFYATIKAVYEDEEFEGNICYSGWYDEFGILNPSCKPFDVPQFLVPKVNHLIFNGKNFSALSVDVVVTTLPLDESQIIPVPKKEKIVLEKGKAIEVSSFTPFPFYLTLLRTSDSRCHEDMQCLTAGEFTGVVNVALEGRGKIDYELCFTNSCDSSGTSFKSFVVSGSQVMVEVGDIISGDSVEMIVKEAP